MVEENITRSYYVFLYFTEASASLTTFSSSLPASLLQLTLRSYFSCLVAWKQKGEYELSPGGFLQGVTRGSDERPAVDRADDT